MATDVPLPHPSRCDRSRPDFMDIVVAHEQAVVRGDATYRDPLTGLQVLTVSQHLARGTCCNSGCRHCPYVD